MMSETIIIGADGQTLDQVLWRKFGVRGRELVEETLRLNPGLAGLGPVLPVKTVIVIPALPAKTGITAKPLTLFG